MSSMQSNLAEQTTPQVVEKPGGKAAADMPALSVISNKSSENAHTFSWQRLFTVLVLGMASGVLYLLLFDFADQLMALSAQARAGAKFYALVPIVIALMFSAVHGTFTARFWDLLGLKARTN